MKLHSPEFQLQSIIAHFSYYNSIIKRGFSLCLFLVLSTFAIGQNDSALIEYDSQTKGVLIPRMNSTQRVNIANPVEGLMVYDLTEHAFYIYDGTTWLTDNDKDNTNEQISQLLTTGDSLYITEGGITHFVEIDCSNANEMQTLEEVLSIDPSAANNIIQNLADPIADQDAVTKIYVDNVIDSIAIDLYDAIGNESSGNGNGGGNNGSPSGGSVWSLKGNKNTTQHGWPAVLGTTDYEPLVFVTDDIERMRITEDGELKLEGGLDVGGSAIIGMDITVKKDVFLNTEGGTTTIDGPTTIGGSGMNLATFQGDVQMDKALAVDGISVLNSDLNVDGATDLNSTVNVDGNTTLKSDLSVDGLSDFNDNVNIDGTTDLNSTLVVDGATDLNSTLNVDGATDLNSTLVVDGATDLNTTLNVDGATTFNDKISVTKDIPDGDYLATFTNTNSTSGDGLKIKLGKIKANNGVPPLPVLLTASQIDSIRSLIGCEALPAAKLINLTEIVVEGIEADIQLIAGLTIGVGNLLIDFINAQLPNSIPAIALPAVTLPLPSPLDVSLSLPSTPSIPFIPEIGDIDLAIINGFLDPDIAAINLYDLDFWGIPSLCLNDNGGAPLDNENEFIRFTDSADSKMGSIRAVSISDWAVDYLNPVYLFGLVGAIKSTTDKLHARYHFKGEIAKAVKAYGAIGVEYSSGNGDYAEWLERIDPTEAINPGDIVGVTGGKISKDISNAEQVMVVSHHPIVLGNVPTEGKTAFGNNIAFMGQVPVKILGPVHSGDYIVADTKTPGYGIAVNPTDMTIENFKNSVGRSWENIETNGPILVNTVVGMWW